MSKTKISEELKNKKVLEIQVKTNSEKTEIMFQDEKIIMKVKAPPEDNKANHEIIKYLKKQTGKQPKIISGTTSRKKLIKLE